MSSDWSPGRLTPPKTTWARKAHLAQKKLKIREAPDKDQLYIWSLSLLPDTELLKPSGHPRSSCCSTETTLGGPLDSFRMGAGHPKDPGEMHESELSVPPSSLQGRERGWGLLMHHVYIIKPPLKPLNKRIWKASGSANASTCRR